MFKLSKAEISVMLLIVTLFLSVAAIIGQSRRASDDMIERAYANAEDLVTFVLVANRHYIQSVSGVPVEELTAEPEIEPHKMWLPATFATRYTQSYSAENPKVDFKLYSSDPFVFQKDRVLDDFARDALKSLLSGEQSTFRQTQELGDGLKRVRLAVPFMMGENCVDCHNKPQWSLNKQDWKIGDVRGVWEASIKVNPVSWHTQIELLTLFVLIAAACGLGIFVVWPAVRNEVKNRAYFHDRSVTMEEKAHLNQQEAQTDALTQIGNRRYFDSVFEHMVLQHDKSKRPLAVIMFDIDHFKRVNDSYGHDVGDIVIKTVADILRNQSRNKDKLARLGGEEFAILLPDLDIVDVMAIAQRIQSKLAEYEFDTGEQLFEITMSGGIAMLESNETGCALLKRADELLYHAKNTGRNKICSHFETQVSATHQS